VAERWEITPDYPNGRAVAVTARDAATDAAAQQGARDERGRKVAAYDATRADLEAVAAELDNLLPALEAGTLSAAGQRRALALTLREVRRRARGDALDLAAARDRLSP
jgi:hypothetical protein